MTNKEILQANFLDILFEHRNKNYGAYALRKTYPQRLQWSLGTCLGLSLLLLVINFIGRKNSGPDGPIDKGVIQFIDVSSEKQKEIEQPKTKEKIPNALIKDAPIIIAPDKNVTTTEVPDNSELDSAAISSNTVKGKFNDGPLKDTATTTNNNTSPNQPDNTIVFSHKEAEYPGGKEAFARFLQERLNTPDDLEAGQKQAVIVRFMVDVDGSISKTEIVQSGGEKFDKEVIRVLKKMPKWNPAMQNGEKVPVYFTQLVTFAGVEQ